MWCEQKYSVFAIASRSKIAGRQGISIRSAALAASSTMPSVPYALVIRHSLHETLAIRVPQADHRDRSVSRGDTEDAGNGAEISGNSS